MSVLEVKPERKFKWTKRREKAALVLALAGTEVEAAEEAGVTDRTVRRWKNNLEFAQEVDRLTLLVGISSRAERLRIAMRAIRQEVQDAGIKTSKDILDWLKFAQSETDGAKLDLASLFENMAGAAEDGTSGDGQERGGDNA